jgi:large subunit ribosomal protein L24e
MKCSFCKSEIELGTGKMLVLNSGKIIYLCSGKCEKNMIKLRRDPKDVKWVTKKKA